MMVYLFLGISGVSFEDVGNMGECVVWSILYWEYNGSVVLNVNSGIHSRKHRRDVRGFTCTVQLHTTPH